MVTGIWKIRLLITCVVISITVHLLFARALQLFATYEFNAPVNAPQGVVVALELSPATTGPADDGKEAGGKQVATAPATHARPPVTSDQIATAAQRCVPDPPALPIRNTTDSPPQGTAAAVLNGAPLAAPAGMSPLQGGGTFLAANYEKLTYQITMYEIPVGTAELEAKYDRGETVITLRIRSNAAFASVFPVDNLVETRHVGGRFIMAKIRQQEGTFRSDEVITINPGKKRVSWANTVTGRSQVTTVPTDEVLDTLSALYYLRNRQLVVGRTETLHIFDSEVYAAVPVEILSREELRLPNLTTVNTLIVRPLQKTPGIFRRTGDLLIWLTDDQNRVPVKIVTAIALGTVTAELVSAESQPYDTSAPGMVGQATPLLPAGRVDTSVDNIQRIVERSH